MPSRRVSKFTLIEGAEIKPVDGLWPIERVSIPELAQVMYEHVTGRHPALITDDERACWIRGMEAVCNALQEADNIRIYENNAVPEE